MKALLKKCFLRVTLFIVYGLIGSGIFTLIEERNEPNAVTAKRSLTNLKATMKEKYNLTNMTEQDFNQFVQAAYNAIRIQKQKDWTFTNGMGFTFPALTTVGFGDVTPKTALGQGLTIPYCLVGLPLTMLALKTSGEVVLLALRSAASSFEKKVLGRQNPRIGFAKLFWTIIICQAVIICMFAAIEMHTDDWTFLEGVYCWFITFTTIGFGDYVPFSNYMAIAQEESKMWMFHIVGWFVTIPYIIGLVLLSSMLNLLVESSEKIKMRCRMMCRCCACKSDVNANNDEMDNTVVEGNEAVCLKDSKN